MRLHLSRLGPSDPLVHSYALRSSVCVLLVHPLATQNSLFALFLHPQSPKTLLALFPRLHPPRSTPTPGTAPKAYSDKVNSIVDQVESMTLLEVADLVDALKVRAPSSSNAARKRNRPQSTAHARPSPNPRALSQTRLNISDMPVAAVGAAAPTAAAAVRPPSVAPLPSPHRAHRPHARRAHFLNRPLLLPLPPSSPPRRRRRRRRSLTSS